MADMIDGMNSDNTKKPENWKNQLSPAFNEEEIFYSLSVLGVFYVIYAVVKATFHVHYNGASDEELFIQSCYCSLNQRFFYRFWFSLCCVIWFYIHTYSFLSGLLTKRFPKFRDGLKIFLAVCIIFIEYCWSPVRNGIVCCFKMCRVTCIVHYAINEEGDNKFDFSKIQDITDKNVASKIKNNLNLLWFQYCKTYVVGYTGYENDKTDQIAESKTQNASEQIIRPRDNTNQRIECCLFKLSKLKGNQKVTRLCSWECEKPSRQMLCCCPIKCNKNFEDMESQEFEYDCVCHNKQYNVCPNINVVCGRETFSNACSLKHIVRAILFGTKYISQLITVPLLLLQIFDSYSFLCFSPDPYCSHTTEYELHLLQTGITLSFYCSLVIAHLASTMLLWNPWPNDDDSTGSTAPTPAQEPAQAAVATTTTTIQQQQKHAQQQ